MNATGEQVIVLPEFGLFDPVADCVTGRLGNFELNGARGLLLHHGGSGRYVFAMADVAHSHLDQVTGPQFGSLRPMVAAYVGICIGPLRAEPDAGA